MGTEHISYRFAPIPTSLIERMARNDIKGREYQVLMVLIQQTFCGDNGSEPKTSNLISLSRWEEKTGMSRRAVRECLSSLVDKGIIYKICGNVSMWGWTKRSIDGSPMAATQQESSTFPRRQRKIVSGVYRVIRKWNNLMDDEYVVELVNGKYPGAVTRLVRQAIKDYGLEKIEDAIHFHHEHRNRGDYYPGRLPLQRFMSHAVLGTHVHNPELDTLTWEAKQKKRVAGKEQKYPDFAPVEREEISDEERQEVLGMIRRATGDRFKSTADAAMLRGGDSIDDYGGVDSDKTKGEKG